MLAFYSFFVVFGITQAQYFDLLSNYEANGVVNKVYDGSTSIYVTASSDNIDFLKQIVFSNNEVTMSAYDLTQNRDSADSDLLRPWVVTGLTTMTTKLAKSDLQKVSGSVYVVTRSQSKYNNFLVYDITKNQKIRIDKGDYTVVFLNSQYLKYPFSATTFSNWNQPSGSSVYMYNGIPTDTVEKNNTHIFSNPVIAASRLLLIPSVEDFSATLNSFYIRVSGNGGITFSTSPSYRDVDKTKTKATQTTGFYMKSRGEASADKTVYPMRDTPYTGVTGVNVIAAIPLNADIRIDTYDENTAQGFSFSQTDTISRWLTPMIGKTFTISSTNSDAGQFYIQYFFIGKKQTSGTSSATKAPGVETSTKSVGTVRIGWTMIVTCILCVLYGL